MDKVQGVWERCKEKFSNRVAVLEQATTNLSKTLLPMNCGFMLRKSPQASGFIRYVWLSRLTAGSGNRADISS